MGIVKVDLLKDNHCHNFLVLLSDYMDDEMGGKQCLTNKQKEKLLSDLKSLDHYVGFFYEHDNSYVALANCFEVYSTFRACKMLNIHDFVVYNTHRGRGIGKKLMNEIISFSKNSGYCKLSLEVRTDNGNAQSLYRKLGFLPCDPEMLFWQKNL
jgi:ribosomal protein S18 acetylase RimI-like enzyme